MVSTANIVAARRIVGKQYKPKNIQTTPKPNAKLQEQTQGNTTLK